tara:strand:- start:24 stop:749 length:726 start_codon:yes stop_codon:yes gene_type:complete
MLTVDYNRLEAATNDLVLDMGCGAGRHAFEFVRRGCRIVALDYSFTELIDVRNTFAAMIHSEEIPADSSGQPLRGDALNLPFPDDTFHRIICSEVLEHISNDQQAIAELFRVLRPGGTIAVTVPAWFPETICWKLSSEYYAPKAVGGHVRIYRRSKLESKLRNAGFRNDGIGKAHALHSPYWWLKCAVGPQNDRNFLVRIFHKLLVWDIVKRPRITRTTEKLLNPLIAKSIVLYGSKPDYR